MKTAEQWLKERDESIKNFKVMDAVRFIEEIQKDAIERPFKSCATCGYVMKTKHYCPECETKLQEPMSQQLPNQPWTTDQSPDHRSPDPRQPPNPPPLKPCPFCGGRIKPSIFGKILCFFGFHRWHFWGAAQHHVCIRMEDYNGARESIRGNWVTCIRGDCLAFEFERGD